MDPALPRRIVRVEATFAGNRRKRGSGLRLDSEWVLTSQHILEHEENGEVLRAEAVTVTLAAPGDGTPHSAPARIEWRGEEERLDTTDLRSLDASLLRVEALPDEPGDPIRLVPTHLPTMPCEVAGWIRASALSDQLIAPEELSGQFAAIDEAATLLPLRVDGLEPKSLPDDSFSPYGGVSGAPVFVTSGRYAGCVYGVVRKGLARQPDRLFAVSTPALLRIERFRQLLNIADPPPPHEALIFATRRLLTGHPSLARALAQTDSTWRKAWESAGEQGGVDGLIAALCETDDLRKLLEAIEALVDEARDDHERESLRRWAGHLTGLVAHRRLAAMGSSLSESARTSLPLTSPLYAEAVLASAHGEAPRYERRDGEPTPTLQVPASELESGILSSRRAQDQIEILADRLVATNLATPRYLSQAELDIIEGEVAQEQFKTRVEAMKLALEDFCQEQKTNRRPYLLIQQKLRQDDPAGVLDGFLAYMADLLPQLEQVELKGDAKEGLRLERQLKPLWRILDIEREAGDG